MSKTSTPRTRTIRLFLTDPSIAAASGGCKIAIHGRGFAGIAQSLKVTFSQPELDLMKNVQVNGTYRSDTIMECILPDFTQVVNNFLVKCTQYATSTDALTTSPYLVPIDMFVTLGDCISNSITITLHQEISILKVSPEYILMSTPVSICATINLTKQGTDLSQPQFTTNKGETQKLDNITALPVYVRVRSNSTKEGEASCEQIRVATWEVSSKGVYKVLFVAPLLGIGVARIQVSFTKTLFYPNDEVSLAGSRQYVVHNEVSLNSVDPPYIVYNPGKIPVIKIRGQGFVDSGEISVHFQQDNSERKQEKRADNQKIEQTTKAKMVGALHSAGEIHCTGLQSSFGVTNVYVSFNNGRQYSNEMLSILVCRERKLLGNVPRYLSLKGDALVKLYVTRLPSDHIDCWGRLREIRPSSKLYLELQGANSENSPIQILHKRVPLNFSAESYDALNTSGPVIYQFQYPSFFEKIERLVEVDRSLSDTDQCNNSDRVNQLFRNGLITFSCSVRYGSSLLAGDFDLESYIPPAITSVIHQHGPSTGDSSVFISMKHQVPNNLAIIVNFQSAFSDLSETTPGVRSNLSIHGRSASEFINQSSRIEMINHSSNYGPGHPDYTVSCSSPSWNLSSDQNSHLTLVQISYNEGYDFYPTMTRSNTMDKTSILGWKLVLAKVRSIGKVDTVREVKQDLTFLQFLYYRNPIVSMITPLSADQNGGTMLSLRGSYIIDHGHIAIVRFTSQELSKCVTGTFEDGQLRCITPPFHAGNADISITFNSEQYEKCNIPAAGTSHRSHFLYYVTPSITSCRPRCLCAHKQSILRLYGTNLVETGAITLSLHSLSTDCYKKSSRKVELPGKIEGGAIVWKSPLISRELTRQNLSISIALNGVDFMNTEISLYCFSSYKIIQADPKVAVRGLPIMLTVYLDQEVVSDVVLLRLELLCHETSIVHSHGPMQAESWEGNYIRFEFPAIDNIITPTQRLISAHVAISFDGQEYYQLGDLLQHFEVSVMPQVYNVRPLCGLYQQDTLITAQTHDLKKFADKLQLYITLEMSSQGGILNTGFVGHLETSLRLSSDVGGMLTWICPSLAKVFSRNSNTESAHLAVKSFKEESEQDGHSIVLSPRLNIQLCVNEGQHLGPLKSFRYLRLPRLISMSPSIGFVTPGCVITLEFREELDHARVLFRFTTESSKADTSCGVRDEDHPRNVLECRTPHLVSGRHTISICLNGQDFSQLRFYRPGKMESMKDDEGGASRNTDDDPETELAHFMAHNVPIHKEALSSSKNIIGSGTVEGQTTIRIHGNEFISGHPVYVRFYAALGDNDRVCGCYDPVEAKLIDSNTIECNSPPSSVPGLVEICISYNLQQFTNTLLYFEYHLAPIFKNLGDECGSAKGGTEVVVTIENEKNGLPTNRSFICPVFRFQSHGNGCVRHIRDVTALYDNLKHTMSCITPAWKGNALVQIYISLNSHPFTEFLHTGIYFVYYDHPQGSMKLLPAAGPITGGTNVLLHCGDILDADEWMVKITLDAADGKNESSVGCAVERNISTTCDEKGFVHFQTPATHFPCNAQISLYVHGINITFAHARSLHFSYYLSPIVRQISPPWIATDTAFAEIVLLADHIQDFGCSILARLKTHGTGKDSDSETSNALSKDGRRNEESITGCIVVPAQADCANVQDDIRRERGRALVRCNLSDIQIIAGYYEIEVSLNKQQFSQSAYTNANVANYSGLPCTSPNPFRVFSTPFFLATHLGPMAGGPTVTLHFSKRVGYLLAKESKCQLQFLPISRMKGESIKAIEVEKSKVDSPTALYVQAEIDHKNARIVCKAPSFRNICKVEVDIIMSYASVLSSLATVNRVNKNELTPSLTLPPPGTATCTVLHMFGSKEMDTYCTYQSPSISEVTPSCGPTRGNTLLVIQGNGIIDTGQLFVRFRSSSNERDLVLVPGRVSHSFPDGAPSKEPLITCETPSISWSECPLTPTNMENPFFQEAPIRCLGRARAHTSILLASCSLHRRNEHVRKSGEAVHTLHLTRVEINRSTVQKSKSPGSPVAKATTKAGGIPSKAFTLQESSHLVLVDFTLNAGEQFITHSVPFYYYTEPESSTIKQSPRQFPSHTTNRCGFVNRILTLKFSPQCYPSALHENFGDRIAFWFDGLPTKITSDLYDTSNILHDNEMKCHLCTFQSSHRKGTYNSPIKSWMPRPSDVNEASDTKKSMEKSLRKRDDFVNSPRIRPHDRTKPMYYIAASSSQAQEIACIVPEFLETGHVRVFFSFNAQQFIYVGDLGIHQPLYIEQHEAYRSCSCLGSENFRLKSSLSSLLYSIPAHDISNQASLNRKRKSMNNVIRSRATKEMLSKEKELFSSDARGIQLNTWRKKTYQEIRVQIALAKSENEYGKEKEFQKRIVVSVCRTTIDHVISSKTVDEEGKCVFESSDWTRDIHLRAQVILDPVCSQASFTEYSASYAEFYPEAQPSEIDDLANGKNHPIDIILLQRSTLYARNAARPIQPSLHIALKSFSADQDSSRFDVKLVIAHENSISLDDLFNHSGKNNEIFCRKESYNDAAIDSVKLDVSKLPSSSFVIGVAFRFDSPPSELNWLTLKRDLHVIVFDRCTTFAYFTLEKILIPHDAKADVKSCIWIVAKGSVADKSSLRLLKLDEFRSSWTNLAEGGATTTSGEVIVDSVFLNDSSLPSREQSDGLESIMVQFSGSNALSKFSIEVPGTLILPEQSSLSTLATEEQKNTTGDELIEISCVPPSTLSDGYVSVLIVFQGVRFSNTLLYQCYDPRKWAVRNVTPSLIVHGSSSALLRLKGDQFIDTGKISARIVDLTQSQFLDVRADMERTWSIYIRSVCVRQATDPRLSDCGLAKELSNSTGGGFGATLVETTPSSVRMAATSIKNSALRRLELVLSITCGTRKVVSSSSREVNMSMEGSIIDLITPTLFWDDLFELQADDLDQSLIISLKVKDGVNSCGSSTGTISELSRSILSIKDLASNELCQKTVPMHEYFKPLLAVSNTQRYWKSSLELDLAVQLSLPLPNSSCISCRPDLSSSSINIDPEFIEPYPLYVQIFGENDYLMSADTRNVEVRAPDTDSSNSDYAVAQGSTVYLYRFPEIHETTPCVLPRSTGGYLCIRGSEFILKAQENVVIRLFGCKSAPEDENDILYPTALLESINAIRQPHDGTRDFLIIDIVGVVTSPTEMNCEIPARLSTFRVFYRISLDGGITFNQASRASQFLLFSVDKIDPCAGPVTGKTYAALCGSNINACLSLLSPWMRIAHVRLKWMKNGRELERKVITAEHYPPEDVVYFHTLQSRFRLDNLSLQIELCLGSLLQSTPIKQDLTLESSSSDEIQKMESTPWKFSLDGASFYTYRSPSIKSVNPVVNLLPGITGLEMVVQGLDEMGISRLSHLFRARFRCRGQMQTSGLALHTGGKLSTIIPRFNVRNALSVELVLETSKHKTHNKLLRLDTKFQDREITSESDYQVQMYRVNSTVRKPQRLKANYMKRSEYIPAAKSLTLWTRKSGLMISVLRGRKFRPPEKGTCNSFVIINCGKKQQLRTTRRDGSFDPVWNEVLEFDATCLDTAHDIANDGKPMQEVMLYISIYNQVNDQHCETLGSVDIFLSRVIGSFAFRGWFSIHRSSSKYQSQKINDVSALNILPSGSTPNASQNFGMLELSIIFVPQDPPKRSYAMQLAASKTLSSASKSHSRSPSTFLKRDSELHTAASRLNNQFVPARVQTANKKENKGRNISDNEQLARIFTSNLSNLSAAIPTEISAEIALNGQDFSSLVPSQCYMIPPPLIAGMEPGLISMNGGTTLTITGMNFVATGNIKVAFSLLNSGSASLDCVAIVNAKYRSNSVITCMTPSFIDRTDKRMIIYLYISLNGFDFDCIKLPRNSFPPGNLTQAHEPDVNQHESRQKRSTSKTEKLPLSWDDGRYGRHRYTLDTQALDSNDLSHQENTLVESHSPILQQQLILYPRPEIDMIQYVDGPDCLILRIIGRNFIDSASAIASFALVDNPKDQHSSSLQVKSETESECQIPESVGHGILVFVKISFNGQEYISYEKPLIAQHRTRIFRLIPSWISLKSLMRSEESDAEKVCLKLPGINMLPPKPSLEANNALVSFQMEKQIFFSAAMISDNEVQCLIPNDVIQSADTAFQHAITESMEDKASFVISILVDFSPNGRSFIGKPLIFSIHKEPPLLSSITPSNGPIFGGSTLTIDGEGFINTGEMSIRFSLLHLVPSADPEEKKEDRRNLPTSPRETCFGMRRVTSLTTATTRILSPKKQQVGNRETTSEVAKQNDSESTKKKTPSSTKKTDTVSFPARFISSTCITCTTSSFLSEGIYQVSVTLNNLEYSEVNNSTKFLVWQSWQRKRQMLAGVIASDTSSTLISRLRADAQRDQTLEPLPHDDSTPTKPEQNKNNDIISHEKKLVGLLGEVLALCDDDLLALSNAENNENSAEYVSPAIHQLTFTSLYFVRTQDSLVEVMRNFSVSSAMKLQCEKPPETSAAPCEDVMRESSEPLENMHQVISRDVFLKVMQHHFPRSPKSAQDRLWLLIKQQQKQNTKEDDQLNLKKKKTVVARVHTSAESSQLERNEPGPASYDPSYSNVEIRQPSALIMPKAATNVIQSTSPPIESIDHENSVKFIKPRIPQIFISKRNHITSWCNPIPKPWNHRESDMILRRDNRSPAKVQASQMCISASSAKKVRCPERPLRSDQNSPRSNRGTIAGRIIVNKDADIIAQEKQKQTDYPKSEDAGSERKDMGDTNHTVAKKRKTRPADTPFLQDIAPMYTRFLRR
uniref:Uncharacterized protein AlNc14C11G1330 n=1 Tax=Albugo laibachii Nc14 TaxID=890382 RepID=F0W2V0_9STRA|nr:conserved hypothetical protein [Albugo laibachii Nc14]|eukprot:CCA15386.1 conserved hypothetical protein [Albugo laibachii Nc14]